MRHTIAAFSLVTVLLVFGPEPVFSQTSTFDLPAQPLAESLKAVGAKANVNVMVSPSLVDGKQAPALKANLSAKDALDQLLKGSDLDYHFINDQTVVIREKRAPAAKDKPTQISSADPPSPTREDGKNSSQDFRVAQVDQTPAGFQVEVGKSEDSKKAKEEGLSEIVVTGTYIHNIAPVTPITTITHEEIINQGYSTLAQLIDQLPQNFKGGVSSESNPQTGAGNGSAYNNTYASGVNLRGLGGNATLVLLNGQRLAPTAYGFATDISSIPVDLIERVEILTDGASAVYGSDAIAGVVNVITRRDYSGLEVSGRVNSITAGKPPDYEANTLGGFGWGSGNAVLDIDYDRDNPLFARDRSFTSLAGTLAPDTELQPKNEHTSYYLSLQNAFSDQFAVSADVLATRREYSSTQVFPIPIQDTGFADQYSGAVQLDYKVTPDWIATLALQSSKELDNYDSNYGGGYVVSGPFDYKTSSVEARVDGKLFGLPGGDVHMAVGGQMRWERFDDIQNIAGAFVSEAKSSRHLKSAYTELLVPVIGTDNAMRFAQQLRIDVSARYDDYSDFGPTTNPKVAIGWVPVSGLTLHGSYARSFQAPTTYESSNAANQAAVANIPDPKSATGFSNAILVYQTGGDLQPETATSLNVGLTYEPAFLRGVKVDASFFSINFKNQINALANEGFYSDALQDEAELGGFVERNPSLATIEQTLSAPGRTVVNELGGYCVVGTPGCPAINPSTIAAIANVGWVNAASNLVKGVDVALHYVGDATSVGRFRASLDGTYFTTYQEFLTPTSANLNPLNTIHFPLRFRAKANIGWDLQNWAANARINYSNAYNNTNSVNPNCPDSPDCRIAAWTTVDLSLSYATPSDVAHSLFGGIRVSVDVFNVFNRAPPVVSAPPGSGNYPYDPTNANPLLRTVGISFTKKW
jgi:iron complex outermembrane recepter protein